MTPNRTTTYLLPLINIPINKYEHRFVNSYITDKSLNIELKDYIILQLTKDDNISLLVEPDVITSYNKLINNTEYDIIIVKLPSQFQKSIDKIIVGLYNEIEYDVKQQIIHFWLKNNSITNNILDKKEWLQNIQYEMSENAHSYKKEDWYKILNTMRQPIEDTDITIEYLT